MERNTRANVQTFREYVTNTRALYEEMNSAGRLLADNIRGAIDKVNEMHAGQIDGGRLILTDAETTAAALAYFAEIVEFVEWELIGKRRAERADSFAVEVAGDVVTVRHKGTGYGFRFNQGKPLQRQALTVLQPGEDTPAPEGEGAAAPMQTAGELDTVRAEFMEFAAYRWPAVFAPETAAHFPPPPPLPKKRGRKPKTTKRTKK